MSNDMSAILEGGETVEQQDDRQRISKVVLTHKQSLFQGTLAIMFLFAFIQRVSNLDNSRHVAEVQYRSALVARSIFFNLTSSIPEWRRLANTNSLRNLSLKNLLVREPPVTELLSAIGYKLLGREELRIPRLLTSIYWLVGGLYLFKIAKDWGSRSGAIVATAYYLFIPLGVIISISFQADSLMIMMSIISLYAILQYYKKLTWYNLIIAAIFSGFAFLVRPLVLFAISGAFLGLTLFRFIATQQLFYKKLITFYVISYIPVVFYYGYEIFITGNLTKQAEVSFLPQLLVTKNYWKDWMQTAIDAVGLTPLVAAIVGIPMTRNGAFRALLIGLGGGYILFCLVFTYHIRYAGYYHTQLIPIVALSCASIVSAFARQVSRLRNRWYWSLFYIAALFLLLFFNFRETNRLIHSSAEIEDKEVSEEIGEIVDHSQRVAYVASYYGWPLEYYAELTGTYWPRSTSDVDSVLDRNIALTVEDRLESLGFTPEYFVITNFEEYSRFHQDLKAYLVQNCSILAETGQYLIYHSCAQ